MLHHGRVGFIRYYWSDTAHAHDSIFVLSAPAGANQSLFSRTKYTSLPLSGEIIVAAYGGSCDGRKLFRVRDFIVGCARKWWENIVRKTGSGNIDKMLLSLLFWKPVLFRGEALN